MNYNKFIFSGLTLYLSQVAFGYFYRDLDLSSSLALQKDNGNISLSNITIKPQIFNLIGLIGFIAAKYSVGENGSCTKKVLTSSLIAGGISLISCNLLRYLKQEHNKSFLFSFSMIQTISAGLLAYINYEEQDLTELEISNILQDESNYQCNIQETSINS